LPLPDGAADAGTLLIRPDGLRIDARGTLRGRVIRSTFRGDHTRVVMELDAAPDGDPIEADVRDAQPVIGERLTLAIAPSAVVILAPNRPPG
jgi:ABC-type Fe3+/spermidine/putrescine transport system ATPase subunit